MESEEQVEYFDITPHKSILPKIGRAGYSVAQAIAEFVDNSLDAKQDNEKLLVNITVKSDYIEIYDNGMGMDKQELAKAFSLAYSTKKEKLGEFGLGLKTACQSLGTNFSIITSRAGDKKYYRIDYDEEEWLKSEEYSWKNYPIKILKKTNFKEHGTTIIIKKLRVKTIYAVEQIKKDVGNRFAPFIKRNEVEIKVNNIITKPLIPELIEGSQKSFEINVSGKKIYGWYALMREGSQKGFYGFNVFRRGRMITCYDKIGIPEHATVARITGEIHLDHVPVTHNKREFIKESDEYIMAEEALAKELKEIVRNARKKAKDDKVTSNVRQEVDIWKEKLAESLKTPELKNLLPQKNLEKKVSQKGKEKEETNIEKREEWKLSTPPLKIKEEEKVIPRERKPKKLHRKRHVITLKGKRFDFNVDYAHLGKNESWKKWSISDLNGIEIIINTDFPAWLSTKDTPFYVVILVGEALAEIVCREANEYTPEKISEFKEEILRKASELKNQFEEEVEQKKDEYREATSFVK